MDVNVRKTKGVQLLDATLVSLEKGLVLTQSNVFSVKSGSFAIAQMASNTT